MDHSKPKKNPVEEKKERRKEGRSGGRGVELENDTMKEITNTKKK